ncbi:MAG: hypothetical protein COV60_01735 [Candidatus Magasanikbacteria bacterium CG11_big_fil_rev_8_21_14_0_20_43_7]|uniref:Periplasmic copper-binding protein NosD beta helix domain-containing protein n=1 Tax=Candidatus Magasanikbacteria bacterium CG11_big_fil_rev_8_21_14_0_20_43_7 TaxID=1974654 RepID=A0A2H0N2Q7_9BACT|nr:MAG: hypothetical protein COV60_01735 [Candidatus Magasanikbacteria bacterium CG11_big_fil_rev_8_21_14_0_20_43_7]
MNSFYFLNSDMQKNIYTSSLPLHIVVGLFFAFALWSMYTPFFTGQDIPQALAVAPDLTVCDVGCTHTSIVDAIASSTDGYVIEVGTTSTYTPSNDASGFEFNVPNLTLQCANDSVIIGVASHNSYSITVAGSLTVQNCHFDNVDFTGTSDVAYSGMTFSNNTFTSSTASAGSFIKLTGTVSTTISGNSGLNGITLTSSTNAIVSNNTIDVNFVESNSGVTMTNSVLDMTNNDNNTFSNNTVIAANTNLGNSAWGSFNYGTDFTIATNTFKVSVVTSTAFNYLLSINDVTATMNGNLFIGPTLSNANLIRFNASTSTVASSTLESFNNTFVKYTNGTAFEVYDQSSFGSRVTSTYNIFYQAATTASGTAISYPSSPAAGSATSSDYNLFWNYATNISGNGSTYAISSNSIQKDPFFSNTTTYNSISEFSGVFDVNGTRDIGHISQARVGTIPIGTGNLITTFDTVSTTVRANDTLNFTAGTFDGFSISSLSGITIDGVGATTIFNAGASANALSFTSSDSLTLTDFVTQNASSTVTTYTMTRHPFSYGGTDYDALVGGGSGVTLFSGDGGFGDIHNVATNDTDISSYVGTPAQDWHLGLVALGPNNGNAKLTIYFRGDFFSDEAGALSYTQGIDADATIVFWATSTLVADDSGNYTYNAPSGPTVITLYQSGTPSIDKTVIYYAGIKLDNSDSATITNVTSTANSYGIWFNGSSASNTVNTSTLSSSVVYDVFSSSTADNTLNNTSFTVASSSVSGAGNVDVYYRSRAYVTGSESSPLAGEPVT